MQVQKYVHTREMLSHFSSSQVVIIMTRLLSILIFVWCQMDLNFIQEQIMNGNYIGIEIKLLASISKLIM